MGRGLPEQGRSQDFISGVEHLRGRLHVGSGGGATLTPKNFGNLQNFSLKIAKMPYLCLFYTKFYKPCVNFSRVGTKNTTWWKSFEKILKILEKNSIEKLTFRLFLERLMLKIEPSEITSFFYNNFFQFRGWNVPGVPPPGYATVNK